MDYLIDLHKDLDKSFQESVERGDITRFAFISKLEEGIQSYGHVGKGLLLYKWGGGDLNFMQQAYTGAQDIELQFWFTAVKVPIGESHLKTDNYVSMQNVLSLLFKSYDCYRAQGMNYELEGEFVKFTVNLMATILQDFKLQPATAPFNNLDIGSTIVKEL